MLVLALTHSPARAGIVGFAQSLPFLLFYLPAGALVDRWNRKRVMLVADAVRGVALGSIALVLALATLPFAQIVVVAFVEGTMAVFFRLSESSALPQIVPRMQLPVAVARNQARDQGADLAGQPLGGALFGFARLAPFLFDAVSYLASFVSLLFIRPAFQEDRERTPLRLRAEIAEGIAWLWRNPFLRVSVLLVAVSNFAFTAIFLGLIVRARNLGASPGVIGVMLAFVGAGAIVGAFAAPAIRTRVGANVVVIGSFTLWAVATFAIAALQSPFALGGVWAFAGFFGPVFNVMLSSYRYALVPDRLLARVQSAALVVAWGAIPLGNLAAGFLLESIGAVRTLFVFACVNTFTACAAAAASSIRNAPSVEELLESA